MLSLFSIGRAAVAAAKAADKVEQTPDMLQVHPRLPKAGAFYCGPVALSNGLMYLARHGHPKLVPKRAGDEQINMTIMLAGNSYLKTFQNKGTSTPRLMLGVIKYLHRQGCEGSVEFQGWRTIDRAFRRQLGLTDKDPPARPDLKWLARAVGDQNNAIVLDIGWYRHREDGDTYKRLGGHWVTLVGVGRSDAGKPDPATLIIHNPDPAAGKQPSHDRIRCTPIEKGALTGEFQGLPVAAKGFMRLQGLPMPSGADIAVLDGAVVVRVERQKAGR